MFSGMDEDDEIEFPEWMIQCSQAAKVVQTKTSEGRNLEQVQGSSSSGFKTRSPIVSSFSEVNEKNQRTAAPRVSQDDAVSSLQHVSDVAFECERLLNSAPSLQEPLLLGLDLDWPSTYAAIIAKTNTIHLCYGENHCLLFEVLHVKKLPLVFIKLIKHPNVRLLGHNIIEDLLKLGKDFNIDVKQVIASNLILSSVEQKLSCKHRWSYQKTQVNHGEEERFEPFTCEPDIDTTAQFRGRIKYCSSFEDCAAFSEEILIRADHCNQLPLGFDLEWPFRYGQGSGKVALIQICPDESICYIFHVFYLKSLPKALILLLRHPKVRLTGLNIANDIRKLGRDFKIDLSDVLANNLIELCTLANKKLHCSHRWSLARLVVNQLKIYLDKGPVRVSNWANKDLTKRQVAYAATDAYVSLLCYLKLNSIQDA
uniref:3'-5' exonuclease n=1 Tax=Lygus hesperus TaxID=30085 RepID=A0A146MGD2_LYGHE